MQKRYADLGATIWPTTPEEIRVYRDSEEARLLPIMKAAEQAGGRVRGELRCAVIPRRMRGSSMPQLLGSITDASARRAAHD